MKSSRVKGPQDRKSTGAERKDSERLTREERARLLAELEAEFEAAERSIREEGLVTPEQLKRHTDALLQELAEEEEREDRSG
ncbi:MAG: hypothetical protein K0R41_3338 [Geminicoccaceae bacterium]|jgi:hypothetical protein|nr:hypothetical protein [Geminicoccaceae bacterium]MDF2781874.1 hypothetical protein [Geminicoccaceae bacterium]